MKRFQKLSSFLAGVMSALLVVSLAGTALAASGAVSFNTAGFWINHTRVSEKGESLQTKAGASIPSVILYTDEQGGKTHYVSVRQLAEELGLSVRWDGSSVWLDVGDDLGTALLETTGSALFHDKFEEVAPIVPTGGKTLLSAEHRSWDRFEKQLALDVSDGRYVSITVTNHGDTPLRMGLGLLLDADAAAITLMGEDTQIPASQTVTRTVKLLSDGSEPDDLPYFTIGYAEGVSRYIQADIQVVQFAG